nr:MalY/PatB family protein [Nocardioides ginsengisegetis]
MEVLSLRELQRRTSMKWRVHPRDVLPLWVAEMDVLLAAPIADALRDAIDAGDTGYSAGEDYAVAVSAFASTRWGWGGFPAETASIVPDVMMGIVEVLRLITEPGDPVIVNAPVYPPFYAFVSHGGWRVVESGLTPVGRIDLNELEGAFRQARALSPRAVYLLSNPHNPTGAVHTRSELESVAALAEQHGVRVIADEIHAPLVLAGARFTPYLSVPGTEDAFSLMSASKAWNLAGLKAALVAAGPVAAASDLARIPEEVSHGPSHLGVIAHTAAFQHGGVWLDALLGGLDANRRLLGELLSEHVPEVGYLRPEGTYLAWLDCRSLGIDTPASGGTGAVSDLAGPARYFLDHARVALSSGHVFGTGGSGHVRLNFATSTTILTEAITRLGEASTGRPS